MSAITALHAHYRDDLIAAPVADVALVDLQRVASLIVDVAIERAGASDRVQTVMTDTGVGVACRAREGASRIVDLQPVLAAIQSGDSTTTEALRRLSSALHVDVDDVDLLAASRHRTAVWALDRLLSGSRAGGI